MAGQTLSDWRDLLILGIYFVFVLVVGIWASCRKGRETLKGYFLAGRNMHWIPIGFSLFASNIGSEHFVGLAGSGAKSGIAVVAFEWGAVLLLLLLGWLFLPVYLTSGLYTTPEYLERRFGGPRIRLYCSVVATVLCILTKISVDIFAGAVFIQQALGWNTYLAISILLIITALYTIAGGLSAVVYTDAVQTVIMVIGSAILSILAFSKVGGFWALHYKYFEAIPPATSKVLNTTCGLPRDDAFHILRDPVHSDLPWPGVLIRSTLCSLWYWCTDQVIVQRTLAAKNIGHARGATIVAGYLKILPLFLMIFPGMISRILYPDEVACVDPAVCKAVCDNESGCSNIAYPKLVLDLAPVGLKGLMLAVMMSALMSSLTSVFNSSATLFTMDIWKRFRKHASEKELLISGRLFIVALVGVSILWIPLIKSAHGAELFIYIQAVNGYIAPPLCAVFLLAVLVPRINEQGAFWGIVIGQAVGATRLVLDFVYPGPGCGQTDDRPGLISGLHFTYFSAVLFAFSAIIAVVLSVLTAKPSPYMVSGLTLWSVLRFGRNRWVNADQETNRPGKQDGIKLTTQESDAAMVDPDSKDNESSFTTSNAEEKISVKHEEEEEEEKNKRHRYRDMMAVSNRVNIVLNVNAIILIAVFVVLYVMFR